MRARFRDAYIELALKPLARAAFNFLDFSSTLLASFSLWAASFAGQRITGERQNLRRQNSGIGRAGLADRNRRDRNAGRHLDRCQQGIHALQRGRWDGHADNGKRSVGGNDARQVCRAASAGDDHLNATPGRFPGVFRGSVRRTMRGGHIHFVCNPKVLQALFPLPS